MDHVRQAARHLHTHVGAGTDIAKRHILATGTQYIGRGVVFIHAGQEFLRTKNGVENSYRSPDSVNYSTTIGPAGSPMRCATLRT